MLIEHLKVLIEVSCLRHWHRGETFNCWAPSHCGFVLSWLRTLVCCLRPISTAFVLVHILAFPRLMVSQRPNVIWSTIFVAMCPISATRVTIFRSKISWASHVIATTSWVLNCYVLDFSNFCVVWIKDQIVGLARSGNNLGWDTLDFLWLNVWCHVHDLTRATTDLLRLWFSRWF